jgi:hypothetical protein
MDLVVYDIEAQRSWTVAKRVSGAYYDWSPQGRLSYLEYLVEPSGSPFPLVHDLHSVDLDGNNDYVLVRNLYTPGQFAWFPDGQEIVILLSTSTSRDGYQDVYLVNAVTGQVDLLISRRELNIEYPIALSLSSDGTTLAIRALRRIEETNLGLIIIFDIETGTVTQELVPGQLFPQVSLGDENFGWVPDKWWLLAKGNIPQGECYNYALYFFSVADPSNSFCIPSVRGVIAAPDLSPDLSHIAFLTVVGPGATYVTLADLTPEYRSRLGP